MRLTGLILVLFFSVSTSAQTSYIEELKDKLSDNQTDSATVMIKTTLARELVYIDNSEAYQLIQQAISLANEKDLELEGAYALRILGVIMREYGFYIKGSEVLLDAKAIFEEYHDELGVANCYLSLGNLYNYLGNQDLALSNEKKAIEIFERLNIPERLGVVYNNIARTYYDFEGYDSASYFCKKSIEVNESNSNYPLIQSSYRNMGLIFTKTENYDSAIAAFNKVLEYHEKQGQYSNKWAAAEAYLGLAKVYMLSNKENLVHDNLLNAKDICVEQGYLDVLKEVIQITFKYNQSIGDYDQLDRVWTSYQNLTDSLLLIERDNKKYVVDWYEERIQKDTEIAEFADKLGKQKAQIVILLITMVFVLVMLLLFINNVQKVRRINNVLKTQKKELEKLNQTKTKLFSIVAHDFISPLSNVYSFSRLLVEDHKINPEDQKIIVQELNQSVENTIGLTKNLLTWARGQMDGEIFNPLNVEIGQLMKYVVQSISSQAKSKSIDIKVDQIEPLMVYGDPAHLEVIFRNIISNAIKFSHPEQSIDIDIKKEGYQVVIKFEDHGVGMSDEVMNSLYELKEYHDSRGTSGEKGTGLGLIICKEFVERNFGNMNISSIQGKGTVFTLSFPVV